MVTRGGAGYGWGLADDNAQMSEALNGRLKHVKERLHEVWETHPAARKMHRLVRGVARRLGRTPRLRTESPNLLPVLIQVLAAFLAAGSG